MALLVASVTSKSGFVASESLTSHRHDEKGGNLLVAMVVSKD
jgi:hypothetical protein